MKRKSTKVPLSSFIADNAEFAGKNVELYADSKVYDEIMDFLLETDSNKNFI